MSQNGYSYTDIEKLFPTFYEANTERINLLFTQVLEVRFNRYSTLTIQKSIDVHRVRQDQIETIEKRRTLRKVIKRSEKNKEDEEDSNIHSYKQYKSKKDFESVLNNEVQKAKQQKPVKRKSERDDSPKVSKQQEKDTEEIFSQILETDDDSETEESEASVILITPPPTVEGIIDVTVTPPQPFPQSIRTPPSLHPPAYLAYSHGHKILHDNND
jgi:hypothetical protein